MISKATKITRYPPFIVALHWIMALAIFGMLASGLAMTRLSDAIGLQPAQQFQIYQIHKSSGILVLITLSLRIITRLSTTAPKLPQQLPKLEKIAAKIGHLGLYAAMITMVISGWVMVSSSVLGVPTIVFGAFEWPHLPFIHAEKPIEGSAKLIHFSAAIALVILIGGHIAAVIKHALFDKENLLKRIAWPRKTAKRNSAILLITLSTIALSFAAANSLKPADNATAAQQSSSHKQSQTNYSVSKEKSTVTFTSRHAGEPFKGTIKDWQAQINFNPDDLQNSAINADLNMASASTGNSLFDGSLSDKDWLASKNHPSATFQSTGIAANGDNKFTVTGNLTLKGQTHPITFVMFLTDPAQQNVTATAAISIDRATFGIGQEADPNADWVDHIIKVNLNIVAKRQGQFSPAQ